MTSFRVKFCLSVAKYVRARHITKWLIEIVIQLVFDALRQEAFTKVRRGIPSWFFYLCSNPGDTKMAYLSWCVLTRGFPSMKNQSR